MAHLSGRSLGGAGTDETVWAGCGALKDAPPLQLTAPVSGRVVVVAPHPDDEVLGAGGTTALLSARGVRVVMIAVTDGEASAPARAEEMRTLRPLESVHAAAELGITPSVVHSLGLPDGNVRAQDVESLLSPMLEPGDLVLAPWVLDGHPDHEATGLGTHRACRSISAVLLAYLVWAWHWAQPPDLPWEKLCRVDLDEDTTWRKRRAVQRFTSQLVGPDPILSDMTVRRLTRDFEVFVAS